MDLTDTTTQSVLLAAASGSQPSTEGGPLVGAWGSAAVGSGWLLGRLLLGPGLLAGVQPPLVLQQLLLKGLLLPSAELLTVQVTLQNGIANLSLSRKTLLLFLVRLHGV